MTPRFVRHFNMLCIQPPSEQSLRVYFYSFLFKISLYLLICIRLGYLWIYFQWIFG